MFDYGVKQNAVWLSIFPPDDTTPLMVKAFDLA
jgi:hypothetical protein